MINVMRRAVGENSYPSNEKQVAIVVRWCGCDVVGMLLRRRDRIIGRHHFTTSAE
jgi:hypothetical protein